MEREYVFQMAMMVARQLPEQQRTNFEGSIALARSGIISMETLMATLSDIEATLQHSQPPVSSTQTYAQVAAKSITAKAPPNMAQPAALRPGLEATPCYGSPPPNMAQPAALRPGLEATPCYGSPAGPFVGSHFPPDMSSVPLTWENVQAFVEGKAAGKGKKGGGKREGKGGKDGKGGGGKGKDIRSRNIVQARRNLKEFLDRHPDFVFERREDASARAMELWSRLEEDRDNLPRALRKHFREAPEVLEDIIGEMVVHTHWPVDKHNNMEKESKAKKQGRGETRSDISTMSNLSSRTTRYV